MRIAILSTILATAATLAACSGGGPGSLELSTLDLGREPVSDGTFGAPFEPPPNRASGLVTTGENPQKPPKTSTNTDPPSSGGTDASISDFDAGGGRDSGFTRVDASIADAGGATCDDLAACCAGMDAGTIQSGCESVVTNGQASSCNSALNSYKQAGYCN